MNLKTIVFLSVFSQLSYANEQLPTNYLVAGNSSLSVLFWDVYDIQLKTPQGIYKAGQVPLLLELIYKRDISKNDLVSETLKQWQRFPLEEKQKQQWANRLLSIWPDIVENDKISFLIDDNQHTLFYYNEKWIGQVEDPLFSDAFSAIWLAPNGPYPQMTKELIGQVKGK